jgi:hypothetical protein
MATRYWLVGWYMNLDMSLNQKGDGGHLDVSLSKNTSNIYNLN